jgi:hypothetical protein
MKRIFQLLLIASVISFTSCSKKTIIVKTPAPAGQVKNAHAPGQVKKVTGSQSAAPYAPGQVKKANGSSASAASPASNNGKSKGNANGKEKKK